MEQAWTGIEKQYVVERFPPASTAPTTAKVNIVSMSQLVPLSADQKAKLEALLFVDRISGHLNDISLDELEEGLKNALPVSVQLSSEDIGALHSAGEAVAIHYAQMGHFVDSRTIREIIYQKLFGFVPKEKIELSHLLDQLRYAPHLDVQKVQSLLNGLSSLELKKLNSEDRELIVNAAEKVARQYAQLGNFTAAHEMRMQVASALGDVPPLSEIAIRSYSEKFHSPLFDKEAITKEDLKVKFLEHLALISDQTPMETKVQLLEIALVIAKKYDREKDCSGASEVRKLGYFLFPETSEMSKKAVEFASQLISEPNKFSARELDSGWQKMLSMAPHAIAPSEREAFLKVAQILSEKALNPLDVDRSLSLRIDSARALFGSPLNTEALSFLQEGMRFVFAASSSIDAKNKAELVMHAEFLAGEMLRAEQVNQAVTLLNDTVQVLYPPPMTLQQKRQALLFLVDSTSVGKNPFTIFAFKLEALRMNVPVGSPLDAEALKLLRKSFSETMASGSTLSDPASKTSFLSAVESAAQEFIKAKDLPGALSLRMRAAQRVGLSPPLADLRSALAKEHPKLGVKLYPIDTTLFKNHTVSVQRRTFSHGVKQLHVEAKLGHPARAQLQKTLDWIQKSPSALHKELPSGFCSGIEVTHENVLFLGREDKNSKLYEGNFSSHKNQGFVVRAKHTPTAKNIVIEFKGVGKVAIGSSYPGYLALVNRLSIDLDPSVKEEDAGAKIALMLAALGLEAALSSPRQEDEERIKILQLFRVYYPAEAYPIERDAKWLNASVEDIRKEIESKVPMVKQKFKLYLDDQPELMYKQEVYPGQPIWAVRGLANEVKAKGGIGLMSGAFGATFEQAASRLASILNVGALSSHDRFQNGIIAAGASSGQDFETGGAEYVFTRLITKKMAKNPNSYPLNGQFQILYDLSLVERCGLVYAGDKFGTKDPYDGYKTRPSILSIADECEKYPNTLKKNEVCLRNRVPPQFIKGVMVSSEKEKNNMIQILRKAGAITKNLSGIECINHIPVDQFIHVGDMKEEYWA